MGFSGDPFLGQDSLPKELKQKMASDLDQAIDKQGVIDDWKKNHTDLQKDLGQDYDGWLLLVQDEDKYDSAAKGIKKQLDKDITTEVSSDDQMAVNYWLAAITRLYTIVANHTGKPVSPPAGGGPVAAPGGSPGAPATQPSTSTPLIVGIGAAAVFGLILIATTKG